MFIFLSYTRTLHLLPGPDQKYLDLKAHVKGVNGKIKGEKSVTRMKRSREVQLVVPQEEVVSILDIPLDLMMYILNLTLLLQMSQIRLFRDHTAAEGLDMFREIVFRAVILCPTISTTQFLGYFLPAITRLPSFALACISSSVLPLLRNLREVVIFGSNGSDQGDHFRDLCHVETLVVIAGGFDLRCAKDWQHLTSLKLRQAWELTSIDETCLPIFGRLTKFSLSYGNTVKLIGPSVKPEMGWYVDENLMSKIATSFCNLKELIIDYAFPVFFVSMIYNIPSLTSLVVRTGHIKIDAAALSRLPLLRSLKLEQKSKPINVADFCYLGGLDELVLYQTTDKKFGKAILTLTNLRSLSITHNHHINGAHLSVLTNLTTLQILEAEGDGESFSIRKLRLPSSLKSLSLGWETEYVIDEKTLSNVSCLIKLDIKSDSLISADFFRSRLTQLQELCIMRSSVVNDSVLSCLTNLVKLEVDRGDNEKITSKSLDCLTKLRHSNLYCNRIPLRIG